MNFKFQLLADALLIREMRRFIIMVVDIFHDLNNFYYFIVSADYLVSLLMVYIFHPSQQKKIKSVSNFF
jgi:hypothetical protein